MSATSYRGGLSDEGVRAAAALVREMLRRCDQERRRTAPLLRRDLLTLRWLDARLSYADGLAH